MSSQVRILLSPQNFDGYQWLSGGNLNPINSKRKRRVRIEKVIKILEFHKIAGVAQLVERQPSKLNVAGSNPVSRSKKV
jgi:hypothetical protein